VGDIVPLWTFGAFRRVAEDPEKIIAIVVFKMRNICLNISLNILGGSRKLLNFKMGGGRNKFENLWYTAYGKTQ